MSYISQYYQQIIFELEKELEKYGAENEQLKTKITELEKNQQKPAEPKRKTLGEICEDTFDVSYKWNDAAKAVAEAIIKRHLYFPSYELVVKAIRKEFE